MVRRSERVTAIEVKSGTSSSKLPGMRAFTDAHDCDRRLLVGGDGIGLEEFLRRPATGWVACSKYRFDTRADQIIATVRRQP